MQTKRIPLAILAALELSVAGCSGGTQLGPCLKVAPCLSEVDPSADSKDGGEVPPDPDMTPCLSPVEPDPDIGPCLEVAPPDDGKLQPCLDVPPPEDTKKPEKPQKPEKPGKPDTDKPDEPRVGPCLKVAPPKDRDPRVGPCLRVRPPRKDPKSADDSRAEPIDGASASGGGMARRDVIESFEDALPADVLAKLRDRKA